MNLSGQPRPPRVVRQLALGRQVGEHWRLERQSPPILAIPGRKLQLLVANDEKNRHVTRSHA